MAGRCASQEIRTRRCRRGREDEKWDKQGHEQRDSHTVRPLPADILAGDDYLARENLIIYKHPADIHHKNTVGVIPTIQQINLNLSVTEDLD